MNIHEALKSVINLSFEEIQEEVACFDAKNMSNLVADFFKPIHVSPKVLALIMELLFITFSKRMCVSPSFDKIALNTRITKNPDLVENYANDTTVFTKDEAFIMIQVVGQSGMPVKELTNWLPQFRDLFGLVVIPIMPLNEFLQVQVSLTKQVKLVNNIIHLRQEEEQPDRRAIYPFDRVYREGMQDMYVVDTLEAYESKTEVVFESGCGICILQLLVAYMQLCGVGPTYYEEFEGFINQKQNNEEEIFALVFGKIVM